MRKHWLDNIRWVTVLIVVIYHLFYMYNAEGIVGVVGKITSLDVQWFDIFMYIVYPWFMTLLFIVSGISSRLYLENHTDKEFVKSRTTKLLVPSTIGLLVFQVVQGYLNMKLGGYGGEFDSAPIVVRYLITCISGTGVLWYIQVLWIESLLLVLVRKIEKDRFWKLCEKTNVIVLILLGALVWGAAQVLNTPLIVVYRFGLYTCAFFIGYFVLSHDEVVERVKKWFPLFAPVALGLCVAFCIVYFGKNYADVPVNRTPLFTLFAWFMSLAMIGGFSRYFNFENSVTRWFNKRSWGLYVFHYLGLSIVALLIGKSETIPAWAIYILSLTASIALAYVLNEIISRLPFFRWAVLGIKKKGTASVEGAPTVIAGGTNDSSSESAESEGAQNV